MPIDGRDLARIIATTLALGGCLPGCGEDIPGVTERPPFSLIFEDDFDGDDGASPDLSTWTFDIGTGVNGWGNQELQFYTGRPDNVSTDGEGHLRIVAREESFGTQDYTSARIRTQGNFEQEYGRFEARIKLPRGQGIWPAFWMLGNDFPETVWPRVGEIDIMEFRGQEPNTVIGSVHGPGYSAGDAISGTFEAEEPFDEDFHEFAVEWDPGRVVWFVDGRRYHGVNTNRIVQLVGGEWVFDHPFFMILNVAVGGNFVGPPDEGTPFPATMLIDYVRVYERTHQ